MESISKATAVKKGHRGQFGRFVKNLKISNWYSFQRLPLEEMI